MESSGKASRTASLDTGRAKTGDGGTAVAVGVATVRVTDVGAAGRDTAVEDELVVGVAGSGGAGAWDDGVGVDETAVGDGSSGERRVTGVFDKPASLPAGAAGPVPPQATATTSINTAGQRFFMSRIITLLHHAEVV